MSFSQRLVVIALMALMVVGIIFIGERENQEEEENEKNAYYQVESVYLWYTDEDFTDFFTNAAVEFHELYPEIRVIPTLVNSAEYLENINEASLSNDSFPDVYMLTNDSIEKAYLSGLASNVRDSEGVLNQAHFGTGALSAVTYDGNYVGYPLSYETTVLLYNRTYLQNYVDKLNTEGVSDIDADAGADSLSDEDLAEYLEDMENVGDASAETVTEEKTYTLEEFIPETFDDIIEFANVYEASDGVEAILKWDVSDIFYNYLFVGNYMIVGGDAGDDTGNISICNTDSVTCMKVYQNLNSVFSIDADSSDYDSMLKDFLDGKFVYTIVTSDAIKTVNEALDKKQVEIDEAMAARELALANAEDSEASEGLEGSETSSVAEVEIPVKYDFGYANIPDLSGDLKSRSLSVTNALLVNGYSEKKDAANKVAAFLTTKYAGSVYDRTGRLPAAKDAHLEGEAFDVFFSEYGDSIPLPKIVETSNLWVQLEIAFTDIWGGEDAEERLNAFANQISLQIGE